MGNDIEIRVRVANNTATGLTAVNNSLRRLKDEARDAGRGLDGLTARAAAATVALRSLKDAAQDASRALRSLNTAARNADGRLDTMSQRSRTLRSDTDDLDDSMRRLTTTMGGLRGSTGSLNLNASSNGMNNLRKAALMLSPALIPIAAATVPIAANMTAAAAAVGVFGLAVAGQLAAVKDAADAEKKYQDAVKKHGAASEQAAEAEAAYLEQVRSMDPATRRASAALSVLKSQYKDWSKSLAGDTMPVVTKSLGLFGAMLPKLTPLVRGTSRELDRLMNVAAGGMQSAGFDRFMKSVAEFSSGALARMTTGIVRLTQSMNSGQAGGGLRELMDFARKNGPAVGETLANLGRAMAHLVAAASETGVGLLQLVNAFSKLVNSIPTGVLSNLMQLYAGLKLVRLAAGGLVAVTSAGALARVGAFFQLMRVAGVGPTLSAAAASMTRFQKAALGLGILGGVALGISKLAEKARGAPPDVDKLTTSLKQLASTGKFTGELRDSFGNMKGLAEDFKKLKDAQAEIKHLQSDSSQTELFNFKNRTNPVGDWFWGMIDDFQKGEESATALKEKFGALDKSLAQLATSGYARQAAEDFETIRSALRAEGMSDAEINKTFAGYKDGVAMLKAEQELAARGMGLFGQQAVSVQEKLNAQKSSADGLRQSLEALNDVNRNALGGMIGFEASIDAAAKAAKENGDVLDMVNGQLDVNSPKAQAAATALNDLATKTKDAALANRESTGSWEGAIGIYERGRQQFIKNARAMGLTKAEAAALANQILKIPDKKTQFKMDTEDAKRDLGSFNAALKKSPGSKSVTLKTLSKGAEQILEAFGLKVKRLPDGSVKVTAKNGQALSGIGNVAGLLAKLNGQVANVYTKHHIQTFYEYKGKSISEWSAGRMATGGVVRGPGTDTSDSVPIMASNDEYVVNAKSSRKHRRLLEAINDDRMPRFAKGGKVSKQAKAEAEARKDAWSDLTVSHFGRMAGYGRSEFGAALGKPDSLSALVSALGQWRGIIMKATHAGTESRLLKQLDSTAKGLLKYEKQLNSVTKHLEKARDKLSSLKDAASSLSSSVRGGVLSSSNITRGTSGGGLVTVASVMGGLTASKDKATAFASALKRLKQKGFSASVIRQIAEAGIDGGGLETAGALLEASSSEVKSMNEAQKDINRAAKEAGKTSADAVYGKAIKEQTKTVRHLEKSQDKLRHSMEKLAKAMEKALERTFKGKAAGGIVGAAAAGGIRSNMTWVGEHGPELLDLPAGSRVWSNPDSRRMAQAPWASMLNTPRRSHAPAAVPVPVAAGGGPSQPIVIQLAIGKQQFGELWVDVGRNEVRARGSIEATLKPPRGR